MRPDDEDVEHVREEGVEGVAALKPLAPAVSVRHEVWRYPTAMAARCLNRQVSPTGRPLPAQAVVNVPHRETPSHPN